MKIRDCITTGRGKDDLDGSLYLLSTFFFSCFLPPSWDTAEYGTCPAGVGLGTAVGGSSFLRGTRHELNAQHSACVIVPWFSMSPGQGTCRGTQAVPPAQFSLHLRLWHFSDSSVFPSFVVWMQLFNQTGQIRRVKIILLYSIFFFLIKWKVCMCSLTAAKSWLPGLR